MYETRVISQNFVEKDHGVYVTIAMLAVSRNLAKLPSRALICVKVSVKVIFGEQVFRVILIEDELGMMGVSSHYELISAIQVVRAAQTPINK